MVEADAFEVGKDIAVTPGAVVLRRCLLDELRRRDPVGVERWLREGPHDPPERYVRDDRDLTA